MAFKIQLAGVGFSDAVAAQEEGGFPGAVSPHARNLPPSSNLQAQSVKGGDIAAFVGIAELFCF